MSEPSEPRTGGVRGPTGGGWPEEAPAASGAPQMSAVTRIWKVVIAPTETFQAIAARPTWGLILVLSLVAAVGLWYLMVPKIDFVESMRQQFEAQGQEIPPQAEKMAEFSKKFSPPIAGVMTVIFPLVGAVIFLALNLLGGKLRFAASYSVLLHSGVPTLIKSVLSLPVVFSRESLDLQEAQTGLLKSSLAAFAPEDAGPRLMVLLASLDVFAIWSMILTIIGFSVAARVSKGTAATFVIGLWAILILVGVFFAGLRPS